METHANYLHSGRYPDSGKNFLVYFFEIFMLLFLITGCNSSNNKSTNQLGEINFTVHANKEAQPFFQKGLLLLHSFEYDDAAENFIKAEELDSTCVMAFWGEAMTYNHPLWRYQNFEKGNAALNKLDTFLSGRIARTNDEIEKDFITGVSKLYGKGSKAERDSMYAAYMEELYKKYPGNNEVAAFYSLALLGSVEEGRDDVVYEHAAEIAKEVLGRNPNHPGAVHYLIHSYDDPKHASLAIDAANKYALIAPEAGHALHMPSHIYLALGMWNKVVASNEVSWAATVNKMKSKGLKNDALGYHYFQWLQYGYLQQGRKEEAKKLLDEMKIFSDTLPSTRARDHLVFMKTTYLIETEDWNSSYANINVDLSELNISTRAMYYFVDGMKAYKINNANSLSQILLKLTGERLIETEKVKGNSIGVCGSVNGNIPNLLDVQQAEVMEFELRGMQAWLTKDTIATDSFFRKATSLENSISYSFGPPVIVKPSNELYGEWLLQINKPQAAMEQFNLSLKAAPNRVLSLQGKEKAAELNGDNTSATDAKKILDKIAAQRKETEEIRIKSS